MTKGTHIATSPCLELDVLSQVRLVDASIAKLFFLLHVSFTTDSEEERENRNKIMDQASRGWFAAGYIPHPNGEDDEKSRRQVESDRLRLCDDSLFESQDGHTERHTSKERRRRRSLVQGVHTSI